MGQEKEGEGEGEEEREGGRQGGGEEEDKEEEEGEDNPTYPCGEETEKTADNLIFQSKKLRMQTINL